MSQIARALSPEDVAAVAQYSSSLQPPAPAGANLVQAPAQLVRPGSQPSAPAATAQPAGPTSHVGSEQGASTTGGSQGPGRSGASTINKPAPASKPR